MITARRCCCNPPPTGLCAVYTVRTCANGAGGYSGTGGDLAPAGTVVNIRATSGGTIVATGVTDASGNVTLCVPTSATRWIEVVLPPGYPSYQFSGTTNATNRGVYLPSGSIDSAYCCATSGYCATGPRFRARTLYVTDANGTWAFGGSLPCGTLTANATVAVPALYTFSGSCVLGAGVLDYSYVMSGLAISRQWRVRLGDFANDPCGLSINSASAVMSPMPCPDVYWSGGLTPDGAYPDPVGGTVVVSN